MKYSVDPIVAFARNEAGEKVEFTIDIPDGFSIEDGVTGCLGINWVFATNVEDGKLASLVFHERGVNIEQGRLGSIIWRCRGT